MLSHKSGASEILSPAVIMTGRIPEYKKHCKSKFVSYVQTHEEDHVQTHEEDQPRNSMKARSIGVITMGPDNSQQAGYWSMKFDSSRRIHRRSPFVIK